MRTVLVCWEKMAQASPSSFHSTLQTECQSWVLSAKRWAALARLSPVSQELIEMLIQFARPFVYTTALPPAQAAATSAALRLLQTESWRREKLHSNIIFFKQQAAQPKLALQDSPTAIQPLLIGNSARVLQVDSYLREHGFLVGAVRPPTVADDAARLRITLSAAHAEEHIVQLFKRHRR